MGKAAQRDLSQGFAVEASSEFDEAEVAETADESVEVEDADDLSDV